MKKNIIYRIILVLTYISLNNLVFGYMMVNDKQQEVFPKPAGIYNVGTCEYYWIDKNRDETFTKNPSDKRRLMVQVWYPTDQKIKGKGHPYIINPEEFGKDKQMKELSNILTNSILDAPISNKLEKYPVLIFSHGMRMTRFSNTSQVEHLVSHGYIVFGIDHTFFNRSQKYPDGFLISKKGEVDYKKIKNDPKKTVKNMLKAYDNLEKKIWLKDAEFVLKKIEKLNILSKSKFSKRIDLKNIGMFGYSMGGITTMEICSNYPNIKAGVSYDGGYLGDAWKKGLTQPFLFVEAVTLIQSKKEVEDMGRDYQVYLLWQKLKKYRRKMFFNITKNTNYILTFSGTTHGYFNDMGLFKPQSEKLMDVRLCHKILNEYTLAFFNKYLKKKESKLLETFPGKYKEIKFQKK